MKIPFFNFADLDTTELSEIGYNLLNHKIKIKRKSNIITHPGKIGEIYIKSASSFNGYYGFKFKNKYFPTGDIGYFKKYNKKKIFFITSRIKEIIKKNDETIYPIDIENAFLSIVKKSLNMFVFGFNLNSVVKIGCVLDKKEFNNVIKKKILCLQKKQNYKYLPEFFFISKISNFKTKSLKPKRLSLSKFIERKYDNKKINYINHIK